MLLAGSRRGLHWVKYLEAGSPLVYLAIILCPLIIALILYDGVTSRLTGVESVSAREKRRAVEEETGTTWTLPRPTFGADWPRIAKLSVKLSALAFFGLSVPGVAVDYVRNHGSDSAGLIGVAIAFAVFIAVMTPINMYFLCPRLTLTLISDGIVHQHGANKILLPYAAVLKVRIGHNPGRESGTSLLILARGRRANPWHRYDFPENASRAEIIEALKSRGLAVEVTDGRRE